MTALLKNNLSIIEKRWPDLANNIEQQDSSRVIERVENNNIATLIVDGKHLTSVYDRKFEAQIQASILGEAPDRIRIYGFALGDSTSLCLEKFECPLDIYIFSLEIFKAVLSCEDYSRILNDSRISLFYADREHNLDLPFIVSPACLSLADNACIPMRDKLQVELASPYIKKRFEASKQHLLAQIDENMEYIKTDADVSEIFPTDSNAIVVGAGPSLETLYEDIKEMQLDGCKVVAVDAAVKALLANGIEPDYIVSADGNRKMINRLLDSEVLASIRHAELVYFPVTSYEVLANWPTKRYCAYANFELYDGLKEMVGHSDLYLSGSVSHPAVDLAVKMGAQKVFLAGCDFGFPGNKTHADGVEVQRRTIDDKPHIKIILDGNGRELHSFQNFIVYLRDLEAYLERTPDTKFYNMSRMGAYIKGAEYLDCNA